MKSNGIVVEKFNDALARSQAKEWDYLPGVIRGSSALGSGTSEARYNLFSLNRGGLSNASYLSNITSSAGVMPSDSSFLVEGLKFSLFTTDTSTSVNDLLLNNYRQLIAKTTFTFFVDNKPKTEGWLYSLSIPIVMWGSGTVTTDIVVNALAFKNISHNPIGIPPGTSFDVEVISTSPADLSGTYIVVELIGTKKVRLG